MLCMDFTACSSVSVGLLLRGFIALIDFRAFTADLRVRELGPGLYTSKATQSAF